MSSTWKWCPLLSKLWILCDCMCTMNAWDKGRQQQKCSFGNQNYQLQSTCLFICLSKSQSFSNTEQNCFLARYMQNAYLNELWAMHEQMRTIGPTIHQVILGIHYKMPDHDTDLQSLVIFKSLSFSGIARELTRGMSNILWCLLL